MKKKILVVDDSEVAIGILSSILENQGFEVIEANNGKVALEKFKEQSPDLVTLDITMPEMNGIEALEEILKINPYAIVLMISAIGQKSIVLKCLKLGAKGYLTKPYVEENVVSTIKRHLDLQ